MFPSGNVDKTDLENKDHKPFKDKYGLKNSTQKPIKSICVKRRADNRYYYPKSIPREREPLATHLILTTILLLFSIDVYLDENGKKSVVCQYAASILMYIMMHLFHRSFLICEEVKHLQSRYKASYLRLLRDVFYVPPQVMSTAMICIICILGLSGDLKTSTIVFPKCMLMITAVFLIGEVLMMRSCPLEESLWIARNNGLDYGSGMAYSFFHGYLNLILPKTGTESKNLKELMQDYEDSHNVQFSIYKLFILIPTSLRCFTSLMNEYSKSIEESSVSH
ncbi:unnamed protein product [Callosobruchus maculatus]|uniref:Stimulator of interferon genes protein n=1 Tax=Callosobruchus maculatus TaxID=64391 RepID=A0A653DP58_CALMS|nr:unnamed protein product [Callosobruchus maculatus]